MNQIRNFWNQISTRSPYPIHLFGENGIKNKILTNYCLGSEVLGDRIGVHQEEHRSETHTVQLLKVVDRKVIWKNS